MYMYSIIYEQEEKKKKTITSFESKPTISKRKMKKKLN